MTDGVRLVRVTRDTLYHTTGTMLLLPPELVDLTRHEVIDIPGAPSDVTAQLAALTERIAALEAARETVTATDS
jgi:hypothetical protein